MSDALFPDESAYRHCPACGEPIRREAVICRFCHADFRGGEPPPGAPVWPGWPATSGPASAGPQGGPDGPPGSSYGSPGTSYGQPGSPYGPPGPPYVVLAQPPRTNSYAIASLVLGIVGMLVGSILALVFGYRAMREIDESQGAQAGRGLAVAGVVLGWVGLVAGILWVILLVVFLSHGASFVTP